MVTNHAKILTVSRETAKTLTNVLMINRYIVRPKTHVVSTLLAVPDAHA
jgi:hypothetical protein